MPVATLTERAPQAMRISCRDPRVDGDEGVRPIRPYILDISLAHRAGTTTPR